jgi:hypothetical protein
MPIHLIDKAATGNMAEKYLHMRHITEICLANMVSSIPNVVKNSK